MNNSTRVPLTLVVCGAVLLGGAAPAAAQSVELAAPSSSSSSDTATDENRDSSGTVVQPGASYEALLQKGIALLDASDCFQAYDALRAAHDMAPQDQVITDRFVAACNACAERLVKEKKYIDALFYLSKAYESARAEHTKPIAESLGVVYIQVAQQQVEAREYDNAIISYSKAIEFAPDRPEFREQLGVVLYNWGVQYYNERNYTKAAEYLNRAIPYRTNNGYVYELLGDCAYYQQALPAARDWWQKAIDDPSLTEKQTDKIKKKKEKLDEEIDIEESLSSFSTDKFIIRYERGGANQSGYKINDVLRSAYRMVGRDFNYFPKEKIAVVVYTADQLEAGAKGRSGGVRALFDGKIRLPVYDKHMNEKTFKGMVWHEYAHALVFELAGPNCPTWLNEGLAQYEQHKVDPHDMQVLPGKLDKRKQLPVANFFGLIDENGQGEVILFYEQSLSMTRFLLKRFSMFAVKKALQELKKGTPFETVFMNHFHMTAQQFEQQWLASLSKKR